MTTSTPTPLPETISPLRFRKALEDAQPAMAALETSKLMDVSIDIPAAVGLVVRSAETEVFGEMRARLVEELPKFNLANYDNLVTYALAAAQADTVLRATSRGVDYQELLAPLDETRAILKSDIEALARRGLIDGTRLSELRGPSGHRNLGYDVMLCCTILRSHWSTIAGRTAVTEAELTKAEEHAARLVAAVARREPGATTPPAAAETRLRAFTLMMNAHAEVRRAFGYLRFAEGDVDRILPSLYSTRGAGRPSKKEEEAAQQAESPVAASPSPASPATTAATTGATNGGAAGAKGAPVPSSGLPDEDPFTKG